MGRVKRLTIAAMAGVAVVALIAVVWALFGRARGTGQTIRVSVRHPALPEKNEQDIALGLEKALASVPDLETQRLEITRLGVTAECSFRSASPRHLEAVSNAYTDHFAVATEAPPAEPAIWIFSPKDLTKELRAVGHVSIETCGEPQPNRVRVAIDTDKLQMLAGGDIVALELAIGPETMMRPRPGKEPDPEEIGARVLHDDVHVRDVAVVTREPRPSRCYAYVNDGKPAIAHIVSPLPGLTADARAKIDALAKEAQATVVHESDSLEARFAVDPSSSFEARKRIAADYALRGKVAGGLDVVGSRMSFDGTGSIVVRRPATAEKLKGLIKETYGVAWGGIRGEHRLEVTIKGDDRKALEKRAKEVQQRVSTLEGVGTPLTLSTAAIIGFVYDVDEKAAEEKGISVPALKLIASGLQGDINDDAAVFIEPRPLDKLFVRGAPLSAYVHMRQRPVTVRLFRTDQKPSIELAFETDDKEVVSRVRQALADSADVSARVLPAF